MQKALFPQTTPNAQSGANHFRLTVSNILTKWDKPGMPSSIGHEHGHGLGYDHGHPLWVFPPVFLAFNSKTSLPYPRGTDLPSP